MKIVKISSKRQITLPKQVLTDLNIAPRGKLMIDTVRGTAVLRPLKSVAEEISGSLTPYIDRSKLGVSFDKIMEETKKEVAKKFAKN